MSTKHKCPATVHSGIWSRGHACGVNAAHEHEGVFFCKTHHPPTIRAKRDAQSAKWRAEMDAKSEVRKASYARQAEVERKAAMFDELLAALECAESHHRDGLNDWLPQVRAAIRKAISLDGIQAVEKAKEES